MRKYLPLIRDFFHRADMYLLSLCCICSVFGMVIIASATASYDGSILRFLIVQLIAFFLGIFLYVVFTVIDVDIIADYWMYLFIFSIGFILILIPFGVEGDTGNKAWLRFLGIGIQPTEVVKIIFVVLMAKHISYLKEYKNLNAPLSVVQLALHFGIMVGLIFVVTRDMGSALIFFAIFAVQLFMAGLKLYWFAFGAAGIAVVFPFFWTHVLNDRYRDRILAPYDPTIDPNNDGINWQAHQSKIALASGQLTGTGLGNGTQTQSAALSQKHTDFIFAAAGEELGMIACVIIIALLMLIVLRCAQVGLRSNNTMGCLIGFGMAAFLAFQVFINIGMCIGLTPVIGLTLPFFSYGGSSLFSTFAAMGIVSGIKYRPTPKRFYSL
ncbi:MAG: FtsW/RodA/SpoVE family cell cycle protein [Candidatus Heteroscillospira sp.]|jgi:rod shape determining protein RodA